MAFEKEELYSVLENASDFIEHSRTKGAYNVKPIKGIRLANGRYLYNDQKESVPSNPEEWGKGDDSEGIDEYGAYKLSENGEKIYDIGDGIEYDYTDGYFIPRNKPDAPPKKWDDAVGAYVPVSLEREEEVYPDIGEEDKIEKPEQKPDNKEEPVSRTKKEKLIEEDKGKNPPEEKEHPRVSGSKVTTWDNADITSWDNADITSWDKAKDKIKSAGAKAKQSLDDLWKKVKSGASSMWERIRNKIRHGEMLDDEEYEFLAHNGIETEEDFLAMVEHVEDDDFLEHHGVKDQRWGVRNGPPYPLRDNQKPLAQKGAEYVDRRKSEKLDKLIKGTTVITDIYGNVVRMYANAPYEHSKFTDEDLEDKMMVGPKKGEKTETKFSELMKKMDEGKPLTKYEADALNERHSTLDTLNKNYATNEAIGRQKTIDMLQSISGIALAGLSVLKTVKEIRNLKSS